MGKGVHQMLGLAAVVIVAIGWMGWRSMRKAAGPAGAAPAAVPSPGLMPLMPYSAPLSDTLGMIAIPADVVSLSRDPFAERPMARVVSDGPAVTPVTPKVDAPVWRVTTTLMAGNRRAALINDVLVYVGDSLPGGGKLVSVERDHVVVSDLKGATHTVAVVKEGNG